MLDTILSIALLALVTIVRLAYSARVPHPAGGWIRRPKSGKKASLLGRSLVDATYWALTPIVRRLVADEVPANAITGASLVFGGAAAMALAAGHFGIGAWLGASAGLCDALDGMVARKSGTASPAGEALDATADRYNEFFFLTGLALHFRSNAWMLALILLALHGSFMVSFAKTKAQALGVIVSRGWMRRPERATILVLGATLSGLATALGPPRSTAGLVPMILALLTVGVAANVSAVRRLVSVVAQLTPKVAALPSESPPSSGRRSDAFGGPTAAGGPSLSPGVG